VQEIFVEVTSLSQDRWHLLVSLFGSSNSPIVVTKGKSDDYAIAFVNPAFENLTGYRAEEVLGRNCRFLQNDDRGQPVLRRIRDCLERGSACEGVIRNYTKDGQVFWNRITVFPLIVDGGIANFVSIQHDASAERALVERLKINSRVRKRLIQELQAKQRRLEQLSLDLVNAQEAERQALARELHDELGQRLSALMMRLDQVKSSLAETDERMFIAHVVDDVECLSRLVRNMNASLRPTAVALIGLEEAIRGLLRRQLSETTAWSFDFSYNGPRLPSVVEITLFRIVQECLTNIVRHAKANYVVVRVVAVRKGKAMKLTIRDDGKGFDNANWCEANAKASKFGLIGIGERTELLGGRLTIVSSLDKGTKIEVLLPLQSLISI
jgi:PAS domain S-box-containing protein